MITVLSSGFTNYRKSSSNTKLGHIDKAEEAGLYCHHPAEILFLKPE